MHIVMKIKLLSETLFLSIILHEQVRKNSKFSKTIVSRDCPWNLVVSLLTLRCRIENLCVFVYYFNLSHFWSLPVTFRLQDYINSKLDDILDKASQIFASQIFFLLRSKPLQSNYLIGKKKVGVKKSRQKIWSVKKLVTCPKFSHFLPPNFLF